MHLIVQGYSKRSKMKIVFSVLISIMFVIIFSGCGRNDDEKAKLKYGIEKFERQSKACDSTGCAKIVLEYPVIIAAFNSAVKDSLEKFIQAALLDNYAELSIKTVDEMAERFFQDYEDSRRDFPDHSTSWEINNNISVIYNGNSIVSSQSEFYHYTGGAHGNSGTYFANFNSRDGRKIHLSDLLLSDYKDGLSKIAENIFRREKILDLSTSLEEAGYWFTDNEFSLNENFGIKNDGLVFFFNSYEIAPYSMGPSEIFIPYSDIKSLIRKDGPLFKIMQEKDKS